MKLVLFLSSVLLVFKIATSQRVGSVVTFGRCPNNCVTEFDSVLRLSRDCAARFSLGCEPLACNGDPRSLTCYNPSEEEPRELGAPLTPGAEIVFNTLDVGIEFPVFVNLSTQDAPVDLDLYLLADSTGSMNATIGTVQRDFNEIISIFGGSLAFSSVHFGVGTYRDEAEAGPGFDNGFKNLLSISGSAKEAMTAVGELSGVRGGDRDEANLVALHKVATDSSIGWRNNARRVVVYFGDVPGHEPTCGPFGTLTRKNVIEDLINEQITVLGLSAPRSGGDASQFNSAPSRSFGCGGASTTGPSSAGPNQTEAITNATAGSLRLSDSERIIGDIVASINALTSTFSVDMSDCEGQLKSVYDPSLPLTLGPGEDVMVRQAVSADQQLCTDRTTSFTCKIRYLQSGVFLPPTAVTVNNIVGCPDVS